MTKRTVTNGGTRTVATKGTGDWAVATKPDRIFIAQGKTVKRFNNWVSSELLEDGTTTITIGGEPIWTKPARLGPPSEPPFPGSDPANYSVQNGHEPPRGEAEAFTASGNLKAEGDPVVRVKDKTFQNARNTTGKVMTEVVLMDLSDDGGDEGGGGAHTRGKGARAKGAGDAKKQSGGRLVPPSGTEHVDQCEVLQIGAACHHGRAAKDGFLQVVAERAPWDEIRLQAQVNGPCGNPHPVWVVQGGPLPQGPPQPGQDSSFKACPPAARTLVPFEKLAQRDSTKYLVRCHGCRQSAHQVRIEVFEPGTREEVVERGPVAWWTLFVLNVAAEYLGAEPSELETQPDDVLKTIDLVSGKRIGASQVVEHVDHRVYVSRTITIQFNPLLKLSFHIDLMDIIMTIILSRIGAGGAWKKGAAIRGARKFTRFERVKKWFGDVKDDAKKKLEDLGEKVLDMEEELAKSLLGEDQGRRERTAQLLKEYLAKMKQMTIDMMPIHVPEEMTAVGDAYVVLTADAKVRSATPDETEPSVTGPGVTGSITFSLKAKVRDRIGISILRVPCECRVDLHGHVGFTRAITVDHDGTVGIGGGMTEIEGLLDVQVLCGSTHLVDASPTPVKGKLDTPNTDVYPKLQPRGGRR